MLKNLFILITYILLSLILIYIFRKQIKKFISKTTLIQRITLLSYLLISLYLLKFIISNKILIELIIIYLLLSIIIITLIIESRNLYNYKETNKELEKLSLSNENLVTIYRKNYHEYKNKLIIIKTLVHKNNKELNNYVDYLINEKITIKDKWLNELRYIKIPSTKNFLNYKLNLLEKENTEIELFISDDLENLKTNKLTQKKINNLNTILGVIIDNMIEELTKAKIKQVSINSFISDKVLHIILANTFSKKPNINKINNTGYSTKGKNRGIGLALVNDIIKSNKKLELETKIEDKFFIQHIKVINIDKYLK